MTCIANRPALEYLQVSIVRSILRQRRRLGLTQAELARRAGLRPGSLNRIEPGRAAPAVGAIEKIDKALKDAERAPARS